MHLVKLLAVLACVFSMFTIAVSQACPSTGISCYPGDCCSQFRQCVGDVFWSPQNTAPGTVCKAGAMVHASQCTTPCSNQPSTPQATEKPVSTPTPTQAATQPPKPTAQATEKPVSTPAPTQAATPAPTAAPTPAPTPAATQPPKPPVQATQRPVSTQAPTAAATPAPTPAATKAPTAAPATPAPTPAATKPPTAAPATPAPTKAPGNGKCSLADVFSQSDFNALFPHANGAAIMGLPNQHAIFNYSYLINAAKRFPDFACYGDVATRQRELSAFLAHTSQESSGWWAGQPYNWGYYFSTELGCTNEAGPRYCDESNSAYPCAAGKGYFGRGPMQLSWNYNYGQVSQYLYGSDVLLRNPDMIFDDIGTAFTTALWFWMTPQGPKPSCHDVMVGTWVPSPADVSAGRKPGFGMTTNVINGGLECNTPTIQKVKNRIGYYTAYTQHFGVSTGANLECDTQRSFNW